MQSTRTAESHKEKAVKLFLMLQTGALLALVVVGMVLATDWGGRKAEAAPLAQASTTFSLFDRVVPVRRAGESDDVGLRWRQTGITLNRVGDTKNVVHNTQTTTTRPNSFPIDSSSSATVAGSNDRYVQYIHVVNVTNAVTLGLNNDRLLDGSVLLLGSYAESNFKLGIQKLETDDDPDTDDETSVRVVDLTRQGSLYRTDVAGIYEWMEEDATYSVALYDGSFSAIDETDLTATASGLSSPSGTTVSVFEKVVPQTKAGEVGDVGLRWRQTGVALDTTDSSATNDSSYELVYHGRTTSTLPNNLTLDDSAGGTLPGTVTRYIDEIHTDSSGYTYLTLNDDPLRYSSYLTLSDYAIAAFKLGIQKVKTDGTTSSRTIPLIPYSNYYRTQDPNIYSWLEADATYNLAIYDSTFPAIDGTKLEATGEHLDAPTGITVSMFDQRVPRTAAGAANDVGVRWRQPRVWLDTIDANYELVFKWHPTSTQPNDLPVDSSSGRSTEGETRYISKITTDSLDYIYVGLDENTSRALPYEPLSNYALGNFKLGIQKVKTDGTTSIRTIPLMPYNGPEYGTPVPNIYSWFESDATYHLALFDSSFANINDTDLTVTAAASTFYNPYTPVAGSEYAVSFVQEPVILGNPARLVVNLTNTHPSGDRYRYQVRVRRHSYDATERTWSLGQYLTDLGEEAGRSTFDCISIPSGSSSSLSHEFTNETTAGEWLFRIEIERSYLPDADANTCTANEAPLDTESVLLLGGLGTYNEDAVTLGLRIAWLSAELSAAGVDVSWEDALGSDDVLFVGEPADIRVAITHSATGIYCYDVEVTERGSLIGSLAPRAVAAASVQYDKAIRIVEGFPVTRTYLVSVFRTEDPLENVGDGEVCTMEQRRLFVTFMLSLRWQAKPAPTVLADSCPPNCFAGDAQPRAVDNVVISRLEQHTYRVHASWYPPAPVGHGASLTYEWRVRHSPPGPEPAPSGGTISNINLVLSPPSLVFDYTVVPDEDDTGAPRVLQVRGTLLSGADGYPYFRDESDPVLVPPGERSYTYWASFPFFLPGAEEMGGFGEDAGLPESSLIAAANMETDLRVDNLPYDAWRAGTMFAVGVFGDVKQEPEETIADYLLRYEETVDRWALALWIALTLLVSGGLCGAVLYFGDGRPWTASLVLAGLVGGVMWILGGPLFVGYGFVMALLPVFLFGVIAGLIIKARTSSGRL